MARQVTVEYCNVLPDPLRTNILGRLPPRYAVFLKMPICIIQEMIHRYPESIVHKDYRVQ